MAEQIEEELDIIEGGGDDEVVANTHDDVCPAAIDKDVSAGNKRQLVKRGSAIDRATVAGQHSVVILTGKQSTQSPITVHFILIKLVDSMCRTHESFLWLKGLAWRLARCCSTVYMHPWADHHVVLVARRSVSELIISPIPCHNHEKHEAWVCIW